MVMFNSFLFMFMATAEVLDRSRFHFARSRRGQNVTESPGDEDGKLTLQTVLVAHCTTPQPLHMCAFWFDSYW